jgi:hypothetical protein
MGRGFFYGPYTVASCPCFLLVPVSDHDIATHLLLGESNRPLEWMELTRLGMLYCYRLMATYGK